MDVSILICTFNRSKELDLCLSSLRDLVVPHGVCHEIVVVDNNSTDGTHSVIRHFEERLPIVSLFEERQGLGVARNRAVAAARGHLMLWLDDDALVSPNWLTGYVSAATSHPDAAFLGGPILPFFDGNPPRWLARNLDHLQGPYSLLNLGGTTVRMPAGRMPHGANMGMKADIARRYGFDDQLGRSGRSLMGGEDIDFFRRLLADGHQGVWVGCSEVRHYLDRRRQKISYIYMWYYWAGSSAALAFASRGNPYADLMRMIGSKGAFVGDVYANKENLVETQQVDAKRAAWLSAFFSGPLWLRLLKGFAYFRGFRKQVISLSESRLIESASRKPVSS